MIPHPFQSTLNFALAFFSQILSSQSGRQTFILFAALLIAAALLRALRPTKRRGSNRKRASASIRVATRQELGRSLQKQEPLVPSDAADARAHAIGTLGEGLVTAELEKTGWPVLRNLILDLGHRTVEIDHVVQVPDGFVVLEVKTYRGFITGSEHDLRWTQHLRGHRNQFLNPVRQNLLHIKALTTFIGDPRTFVRGYVVSAGSARFCPELAGIPVRLCELRRAINAELPTTDIQPGVREAWARLEAEAMLSPRRREDHIRYARARKEAAGSTSANKRPVLGQSDIREARP
jgi:hypothetical protein